ncbi:exodeoxyribonuclease VII small subunit [Echinimonas agarilytica]|uniref:Exodeoxyribonuclease 7 small subunit n=1 Tax=Echinimonas agarilytica TaxID=1215918 RepID=A0AA42B7T4_9GAMM|nr:exodeoxyribonuclease VII small subunit [Echinimonas agarilytica]MCM2680545.1 exodeoxyribonuclease VII small subunit [Echinimonas agarilytica]
MAAKKPENLSFEDAMSELEHVVVQLESGEVPLEQALKQFERGIALARATRLKLDNAEQQVKILLSQDEQAPLSLFDETNS